MLIRLLLCVLFLPSLAHATTDWTEGFEYATNDAMDAVWSTSCPGNSGIIAPSTDFAHSGSKSLKLTYRGNEGVTPGFQSCFKDRDLSSTTTSTLYTRFWIYIPSSFQPAIPTTKITLTPRYNADAFTTVWWAMLGGSSNFGATLQRTYNDPLTNDSAQNYNGGTIPRDQWVCMETQLTYATPGQRNGIIRNWINDVQSMNITNALMDQVGQQSTMRGVRLYTQNGVGNIYYDDYAVSRDARIGCGSSPPPPSDTTPPTTPTNVTASATVPLQNDISWTASTDASSPITYTVTYCTGAACTPSLTVGTTTTTGMAHTGLTGGTVYGYRVTAQDPSGNVSTASSISYVTAISAAGGGSSLVLNSSGKFVLNNTQVFLLGISYFDGQNYRTSDIDTLSSRGFNTLRVFVNWAPDLYAGARSVCDAAGALNATRRNQIQALIDYAKTKNMVVILVTLDSVSDQLMLAQADRTTCLTNLINYYKPTSAQANWNVIFDVVQEHDYSTYADTTTKLKIYTDAARAACASCVLYASGATGTSNSIGPGDATVSLDATMQSIIATKLGTNAESLLAVHDFRSSNWYAVTGQRVAAYKAYLASIGRSSTPVIFDEPNRYGFTYSSTEAQFDQAAADAKAAGAAMWVLHNGGSFDMSASSLFAQLNATETAITVSMAAALSGGSSGTPTSLYTYDFAGTFASNFTGGYTGYETPNQTGGRLQAFSAGNESLAKYTAATAPTNHGATIALTTLGAGTGIQNGIAVGLADAPTFNGYACRWIGNPAGAEIIRKDNNIRTTLTSTSSVTFSAGDVVGCFKNGNTIYMTKGSVTSTPILSAIDSTYTVGGGVGLTMYNNGAAVGTNELDNFILYQYSAPTPACTPTISTVSVTSSGATVTWPSTCTPTQIRVTWGDNGGTYSSASLEPIANFPSGVFTKTWDPRTQFACFYAVDAQGTVTTTAMDATQPQCGGVTIAVDTAEIVFGTAFPSATLPQGTTSATFGAPIDKVGTCLFAATDIAYSAMDAVNNIMNVSSLVASATITGLTNGSSTTRYIRCRFVDLLGTAHDSTSSKAVTIAVAASTADTTAPSTITQVIATALSESQVQVSWTAGTDNVLLSKYNIYGCSGASCSTYALMATVLSPVVTVIIPNLTPNLSYSFVVKAEDSSGNLSAANSNVATVSTPAPLDTTAPSDPAGLTVTGTYQNSITVSWTPGTDNISAVNTAVEVCTGSAACTSFSLRGTASGTTYIVTGLAASTTGLVRIKHIDMAGNVSANYSARVPFTTSAAGVILPRAPVGFSSPRLPRN